MLTLARLGLPTLLFLGFWIYCVLDAVMADEVLVRNLPKGLWIVLVLFFPTIGGVAWLVAGRPERAGLRPGDTTPRAVRTGPLAPDDDPSFLERLNGDRSEIELAAERDRARRLVEWEAELRRREDDLRRREDPGA